MIQAFPVAQAVSTGGASIIEVASGQLHGGILTSSGLVLGIKDPVPANGGLGL